MSPTELTIAGSLAAAVVIPLWSYVTTRSEIRKVIEAKDVQVEIYKDLAEHKSIEAKECRDFHHEKYSEANAIVLRITAENAELKAKTDMTPVIAQLKDVTTQLSDLARIITLMMDKIKA